MRERDRREEWTPLDIEEQSKLNTKKEIERESKSERAKRSIHILNILRNVNVVLSLIKDKLQRACTNNGGFG